MLCSRKQELYWGSQSNTSMYFLFYAEEFLQTVQTTAGLALILFIKTMFEPAEKLPCLVSFMKKEIGAFAAIQKAQF